jgi:segregation and condensation protein A
MSESATPETGALSVDQAIASLLPAAEPVEQEQASEAPLEAAETTEPEGETKTPEDAEAGAETPTEGEEAEAAAEPVEALEPPRYWSTEAKARFAELTPDLQAVVLSQEGPREEATAKAKAEAAKQAEAATLNCRR